MYGQLPMPKMPSREARKPVEVEVRVEERSGGAESENLLDRIGFTDSTMRCESCAHHEYTTQHCSLYNIPAEFDDGCREGYEPMSSGVEEPAGGAVEEGAADEVVP